MEGVVSVAHHHKNHPSRRKEKTEREASPSGSSLLPRQYGTSGTGNQPGPSGPILYTLVENNARIWARSCGIYTNTLTPQSSARSCLRRSMGNFKVCKIK